MSSESGKAEGAFSVDPSEIQLDDKGQVVIGNARLAELLKQLRGKSPVEAPGVNLSSCGNNC
ncbi:hypothetical protein [Streptomyces sp. NPDC003077]|uniref:hypothetical protein n=1 Tax=Streptomyces sp. NPDC003077 TaxID=3154443 RepID=UPI0033A42133